MLIDKFKPEMRNTKDSVDYSNHYIVMVLDGGKLIYTHAKLYNEYIVHQMYLIYEHFLLPFYTLYPKTLVISCECSCI